MSITSFSQVFSRTVSGHMIRIFQGRGYHVGYVDGARVTGYISGFGPCLSWCQEVAEAAGC